MKKMLCLLQTNKSSYKYLQQVLTLNDPYDTLIVNINININMYILIIIIISLFCIYYICNAFIHLLPENCCYARFCVSIVHAIRVFRNV